MPPRLFPAVSPSAPLCLLTGCVIEWDSTAWRKQRGLNNTECECQIFSTRWQSCDSFREGGRSGRVELPSELIIFPSWSLTGTAPLEPVEKETNRPGPHSRRITGTVLCSLLITVWTAQNAPHNGAHNPSSASCQCFKQTWRWIMH